MVTELRLLAVRPPTDELLVVVEEAITVWATLSGYLNDAWGSSKPNRGSLVPLWPKFICGCARCTTPCCSSWSRGWRSWSDADGVTYLDVPEGYAVGVEGLAEFEALLDGASR